MDPATIVSIGSTLLGGLFGQKKEKYVVPDYAKIRKDAEAAGFNPLTALTMGPQGSVVSSGGTMGSAIADAGLMLADSLAKSKKSGILAKVQSQNAELQRKVQNLTLRPKVGGVYARQQTVPTVKQALGVKDAARSGAASGVVSGGAGASSPSALGNTNFVGAGRVLPDTYPIDDRRAVEHDPIKSTAGVMVVDSPLVDRPMYVMTLDGDEPLGPADIPKMALSYGFSGMVERAYKNGAQPKRASLDVLSPWSKTVAARDRYDSHLGRHRPGQWRDPGSPIRQHYKADTSAYWAWPSRDAWPKFKFGN